MKKIVIVLMMCVFLTPMFAIANNVPGSKDNTEVTDLTEKRNQERLAKKQLKK